MQDVGGGMETVDYPPSNPTPPTKMFSEELYVAAHKMSQVEGYLAGECT